MTDDEIKKWEKEYMDTLNKHFELAKKVTKLSIMAWIDTPWTGFFEARDPKKVRLLKARFHMAIGHSVLMVTTFFLFIEALKNRKRRRKRLNFKI